MATIHPDPAEIIDSILRELINKSWGHTLSVEDLDNMNDEIVKARDEILEVFS